MTCITTWMLPGPAQNRCLSVFSWNCDIMLVTRCCKTSWQMRSTVVCSQNNKCFTKFITGNSKGNERILPFIYNINIVSNNYLYYYLIVMQLRIHLWNIHNPCLLNWTVCLAMYNMAQVCDTPVLVMHNITNDLNSHILLHWNSVILFYIWKLFNVRFCCTCGRECG